MRFEECFLKHGTVHGCVDDEAKQDIDLVMNPAAKKSLHNWLTQSPPTPKYINGPFSLTRHENQTEDGLKSYVYVFGEMHGIDGNCGEISENGEVMDIQDFLSGLVNTSPVFLDIFLEMWQDTKTAELRTDEMYLAKIVKKLKKHVPLSGVEKSEYKRVDNVRIHAVDTRKNKGSALGDVLDYLISINGTRIGKSAVRDIINALRNIVRDTNMPIKDYIHKYYLVDRVKKEVDKLGPDQREHLLDIFEMFAPSIDEYRDALYKIFRFGVENMDDLPSAIIQNLSPLYSYSMDIYLLARMFKTFDTTNEPNFPHNAIIYAGEHHAGVYRFFFDELGYSQKTLTLSAQKNNSERCIHIDTIAAYPLFDVAPNNS